MPHTPGEILRKHDGIFLHFPDKAIFVLHQGFDSTLDGGVLTHEVLSVLLSAVPIDGRLTHVHLFREDILKQIRLEYLLYDGVSILGEGHLHQIDALLLCKFDSLLSIVQMQTCEVSMEANGPAK